MMTKLKLAKTKPVEHSAEHFKLAFSRDVKIHFVGVW
jgi:uncharacterized protein (DUF2235 family)